MIKVTCRLPLAEAAGLAAGQPGFSKEELHLGRLRSTIQHYNTTTPLYYNTITLQHYNTTILHYTTLYYNIITLQHHYNTTLQRYNTIISEIRVFSYLR